jgi:hypothetical protein
MKADANARRAARAADALKAFREGAGADDDLTSISDLIADLGHLAKTSELDFVGLVARALSVWAYERRWPDGCGASPQVTVTIAGRRPKCAWPDKAGTS